MEKLPGRHYMQRIRLTLVGFGVVGQGFAELLSNKHVLLEQKYDVDLKLVGVANARHGFIYREEGLHIPTLLELAAQQRSFTEHPGIRCWNSTLEGLQATGADILVEATPTNLRNAEPALSHMRTALSKGMHVVTANKGPGALAAHELFTLARQHGVQLRMESAVMAGTPAISAIREGMAGASVTAIRGILNGTTNYILTAMASGRDYAWALADAQAKGYAETDPTADVEGYDAVAKTLILAALIFEQPLTVEQVERQGITTITGEQMQAAADAGKRIKLIASLRLVAGQEGEKGQPQKLEASVKPLVLPLTDPLARVDGAMNAITVQTDTLSEVTIIGPGAGRIETGQGLLADVLACVILS
ncbi:MAG: homoserine dehydrogenase [Chloroflexi bacterium]|nr:MAG: homoserine dehydrogenase [Chloroflexota bacterium]TMF51298.1 MAG: homoserine dehydrogenase [Chloroflexota bacterium]